MKVKRGSAGKYALIRLSDLMRMRGENSPEAVQVCELASQGFVEFETPGSKSEFFVVKLADCYAQAALEAYADAAAADDEEYAAEVRELARRAGKNHQHSKKPD